MTWVKICGMTNLEDALVAVEAGADAVGFVFYEKSPRYVTVETAREICEKLPGTVEKVGVFVNEPPERVSAMVDDSGITAVQFHGDEYKSPEQYAISGKIFFSLPALRGSAGPEGSDWLLHHTEASRVLWSSAGFGTQDLRGGTGKTFAWGEARGWFED